jgi:hypothetical protein
MDTFKKMHYEMFNPGISKGPWFHANIEDKEKITIEDINSSYVGEICLYGDNDVDNINERLKENFKAIAVTPELLKVYQNAFLLLKCSEGLTFNDELKELECKLRTLRHSLDDLHGCCN